MSATLSRSWRTRLAVLAGGAALVIVAGYALVRSILQSRTAAQRVADL